MVTLQRETKTPSVMTTSRRYEETSSRSRGRLTYTSPFFFTWRINYDGDFWMAHRFSDNMTPNNII